MTGDRDLFVSQSYWRLFEDEAGALYLGVMVGGVAMYEVRVRLLDEEIEAYRSEGERYLDDLAYRVAKDPSAYEDRTR